MDNHKKIMQTMDIFQKYSDNCIQFSTWNREKKEMNFFLLTENIMSSDEGF